MRVGVLRGGPGPEYEVSLRTGQNVLRHLPEQYDGRDILIDRRGVWHLHGLPTRPARVARQVDVFFNALHGQYGEDGQVQSILDEVGMPYTGSGLAASALAMRKDSAKTLFKQAGLRVPPGLVFTSLDGRLPEASVVARQVFEKISPPWVVKPVAGGSSVGVVWARTLPELIEALSQTQAEDILVEHYLRGREVTGGVVDDFRGRDVYPLPPIEIRRPDGKPIWNYTDKYSGETEEVCPGAFSDEERKRIESAAVAAHRALGLRHYSRSDFILTPYGLYILEANSLPGLTTESLLPKALAAVGTSYADFLDHVINLAVSQG